MKKIISILLALALCFSLAISVSADTPVFVSDEFGYLANEEVAQLNQLAYSLYEETGVGIFFVFTYEDPLTDYDVSAITGGIEDYVIMTQNETHWYMHLGGRGEEIDLDTEDALREVYDVAETYVGGVEDFLYAAAELFPPAAEAPAGDVPAAVEDSEEYLVFDEADLLSDAEEAALQEKLLGISHSHNAQIVVITIATLNGGDVDGFLNHIYDSMEFGYGENHDGVLLLVCMDPREFRILSNGLAADAISTFDIDVISEMIKPDLSDGDYADAFNTFADQCDEYLGDQTTFNVGKHLIICLVIGILAGVIVAFILKAQLKTVRKQNQANVYVQPDSMHLTVHNDFFLYRDVTRTKKESSSSSSSGSSRNTGGGSF